MHAATWAIECLTLKRQVVDIILLRTNIPCIQSYIAVETYVTRGRALSLRMNNFVKPVIVLCACDIFNNNGNVTVLFIMTLHNINYNINFSSAMELNILFQPRYNVILSRENPFLLTAIDRR